MERSDSRYGFGSLGVSYLVSTAASGAFLSLTVLFPVVASQDGVALSTGDWYSPSLELDLLLGWEWRWQLPHRFELEAGPGLHGSLIALTGKNNVRSFNAAPLGVGGQVTCRWRPDSAGIRPQHRGGCRTHGGLLGSAPLQPAEGRALAAGRAGRGMGRPVKASARSALAWLALLAGPACLDSPYANLGQILDATVSIAGTTWIASVDTASGPEVRLLVVAGPDSPSGRTFIHTSMIGIAGPEARRHLVHGRSRDRDLRCHDRIRAGGRGVEAGRFPGRSPEADGRRPADPLGPAGGGQPRALRRRREPRWQLPPVDRALSRLGTAGATAAACFFQAFNVTVVSSQVRILGFNSAAIVQYTSPATFAGEASGNLVISLTNLLSPLTDVTYGSFSDFPEMVVDGTQMTKVNLSGNGFMYGTLDFTFLPVDADGVLPRPRLGHLRNPGRRRQLDPAHLRKRDRGLLRGLERGTGFWEWSMAHPRLARPSPRAGL